MNPLLLTVLVDTVIAINPVDLNTVYVHEWGIVTLSCENIISEGVPDSDIEIPLYEFYDEQEYVEPVARAPVVYFYGAEFSGRFSVELSGGRFIEAFPLPSGVSLDDPSITWNIQSSTNYGYEYKIPANELPETKTTSGWAMNEWRDGPALVLEFENSMCDRFIFYENTLSRINWYPLLDPMAEMDEFDAAYLRPLLVFRKRGVDEVTVTLCSNLELQKSANDWIPVTDELVMSALCDMANGKLKSHEIEDLWYTWDDIILAGGWDSDMLILFPLTDDEIDNISTLHLATDQGFEVEYERFFLGMVGLND